MLKEHSAGGVVYREAGDGIEVCLIQPKGTERWQLPKGHVELGEEPACAALREAQEETGLNGNLGSFIDAIDYTFENRSGRGKNGPIHKEVQFYLVRASGGSLANADAREVARAQWVQAGEALQKLSFENERRILRAGLKLLTSSP